MSSVASRSIVPSSQLQPEPLVLLHGWGSDRRSWQPLQECLSQHFECLLPDLPGFAEEPAIIDPDAYIDALLQRLPARFVLLGWSLGGMLATRIAARYPQRVKALVTLATNVTFVARESWPQAMPVDTFAAFREGFAAAPQLTVKRFATLMAMGDQRERELQKPLRECTQGSLSACNGEWSAALDWLRTIDNRQAYAGLSVPGLHLLAATDALVPGAAADELRRLNGLQQVEVVPGCGHALHWSQPQWVARRLAEFVLRAEHQVSKLRIAESFGRAAPNYDSVAELQRRVGNHLLRQASTAGTGMCLDLGSGTGYFTPYLAQQHGAVIGLDLAEGMLRYAREKRGPDFPWVCGDAEQLPLADGCVNQIFSAMAIQWCANLPQLFRELRRVLRAGGRIHIATLGPATLQELRQAWSLVDGYTHVNEFASPDSLRRVITVAGLRLRNWESQVIVLQYQHLRELTHELKTLGAHNMNRGQNSGLSGRRRIARLREAYEEFRDGDGRLPASYEVYFLELGG